MTSWYVWLLKKLSTNWTTFVSCFLCNLDSIQINQLLTFFDLFQSTEIQKLVVFQMCIYFQINQLLQHWFCFPLIYKLSKALSVLQQQYSKLLEIWITVWKQQHCSSQFICKCRLKGKRQGFYLFNDLSEQNGCCKSAWIVSSEIMMSQSLFVATLRRGSGVHLNLKNQWLLWWYLIVVLIRTIDTT